MKILNIDRSSKGHPLRKPIILKIKENRNSLDKKLQQYIIDTFSARGISLAQFTFDNKSAIEVAKHYLFHMSGSQKSLYQTIYCIEKFCRWLDTQPDRIIRGCLDEKGAPRPKTLLAVRKRIDDFIAYEQDRKLSPGGIRDYVRSIKTLFRRARLIYPLKYEQMIEWFAGASLVHVLDFSEPTSFEQVERFWEHNVVQLKWEGLVIRLNGAIWKVKPNCDVDVAIIGVNKNNKGYEEGKAKSLKMALINEDGDYVEIGDCSGIGEDESKELFELTKNFKIGEDNTTVFVQPVVIAAVEYIQTYPDTRNKVYRIENGQVREIGETTLVRLRNPHVKGYRADKKACIKDVGLNQVS
jgi:hypothetical protein